MAKDIDSAILAPLQLPDSSEATISSHGSSGFSSTLRITITDDIGKKRFYFAKSAPGMSAATMFAGEYASLNAIHNVVPSLCPAALGHGELRDGPGTYFLVTDWLDLSASSSGSSSSGSGMSLAQKLAKLHSTPVPIADGHDEPMFGFPVTTCCGNTPQVNDYRSSWAEFYAENRLRAIASRSEKQNGKDGELRNLIEQIATRVVPRLLRDGHLGGARGIVPVVVHGDLWSGNHGRGKIGSDDVLEEVVFDPSACYAHSEFEFGIMKMFGGFGGQFAKEYHNLVPKTEPVEEFDDRVKLYELYHHLNHHAMFGGGYRSGAITIMNSLLTRYGP